MNDLIIKDSNGKDIVYKVLFTFDSDETNKTYIVYTDGEKDSNGNIKAYTLCYVTNDPKKTLLEVNNEKELNTIMNLLIDFMKNDKK